MEIFKPLPTQGCTPEEELARWRFNSLGSLFYFTYVALRRKRMVHPLHTGLCRTLEREHIKDVLEIPRGHFKAVDVNTPIPTPDGFKAMAILRSGDEVYTTDGSITKIKDVSEIMTSSKCFRITFSSGDTIIADAGHLWLTDVSRLRHNFKSKCELRVDTTENLAKSVIYTIKVDKRNGKVYPEYNHRIPVAAAVEGRDALLPVHPYTLGAWLGDGDTAAPRLTSETDEIPKLCEKFGAVVSKETTLNRYGFVGFTSQCFALIGVLGNKHIPKPYLLASREQRMFLLQGLMDTDGSVNKEGQCQFTNTNYELVKQIRILLASLGYKPGPIGCYDAMLDGKKEYGKFYVITFYAWPEYSPFLLQRKVSRLRRLKNTHSRRIIAVEPCDSVPVKCISVEHKSEMFLIGESFIPTHNSTIAGEALPMWRALPLMQKDIDEFYQRGYSDEFVRYMKRMHDPDKHHCLVSQNITNAAKLGHKIRWHFESNAIYRSLFPETLPDTNCKWTDFSLQIKPPNGSAGLGASHGEGTFDFLGIDSAIQSRHYDGLLIQDDLVGRKAIESQSVMDKTIEYHQILPGVFDDEDKDHERDELVIGNRWSFHDLNSHLREHEPWFRFESHSALGGCCDQHSPDTPIFPDGFSFEKLMRLKERFGTYQFSCQYLNNPSAPENADFNIAWLNYFDLEFDPQGDWVIRHEVKDGLVRRDLKRHRMSIAMTVDPNHSGNMGQGRCRHAIVVLGQSDSGNYYLLDSWAQAASFDNFYQKIFEFAIKWGLHRIGVETIASQIYVAHHIEHLAHTKGWSLRVDPLKGEVEGPDGTLSRKKEWRIRNIIAPIAEQGRLFIKRTQQDFVNEYQTFPKGKYVDQLDAFAYAPQLLKEPLDYKTHLELLAANREGMERVGSPYSAGYSRYTN